MKLLPFSKNRQIIHDLLYRAKTFHMPITVCLEIDCTTAFEQLRAMRKQGDDISFSAFLVAATALLLEENPHLNRHLFTRWSGKKVIAQFDHVACSLVIQRVSNDGEKILLPLVIQDANKKSLQVIEQIIQHHKHAPIETLESFQKFERLKKLPYFLLRFISFKTRSDPNFFVRFFGTYALSTIYSFKSTIVSGSTVSGTAISFLPYSVAKVEKSQDEIQRRQLRIALVLDHYLLDGQEIAEAGYRFQKIIENPERVFARSKALQS